MEKRDSWWDEAALTVLTAGVGAGFGQLLQRHPVIGAIAGALVGLVMSGVVHWRYIKPLAKAEELNERLTAQNERLTAENAELKDSKPRLVLEGIESRQVDVDRWFWMLVLRNDGAPATFTAKYEIRADATAGRHDAMWGTLVTMRPPQLETVIPRGGRAELRLAETRVMCIRGDHPPETVIRSVQVFGANKLDPYEPYSQKHVEGQTPKPPPCALRLSVYSSKDVEPFQRSFVVTIDGIKPLDLDTDGRSLLLQDLSPAERVREAREWFKEVVLAAKAGDVQARAKVSEVAQLFRDASRQYGASGPLFQADRELIRRAHEELQLDYRPPTPG